MPEPGDQEKARVERVLQQLMDLSVGLVRTIRRGLHSACPEERAKTLALQNKILLSYAQLYHEPRLPHTSSTPRRKLVEDLEDILAKNDQPPIQRLLAVGRRIALRRPSAN